MPKSLLSILFVFITLNLSAQFNSSFNPVKPPGATNMNDKNKDDKEAEIIKPDFTFKKYIRSLAGKDSLTVGQMWTGALLLPGSAQLYNKQYWKIPIVYASIGSFMYAGYHNNMKYHESGDSKYKNARDLYYLGAALSYWSSLMDGVASYKYYKPILPGRASLYSALLPGLGQAYNGDYWKIPIFYGGFITTGYFIYENQSEYNRFKKLYSWASEENSDYDGGYSISTLKWYKDTYRRYRDYSIISGALVYILNVVDANVFAHLRNFDVSDDLSININPAVIEPIYPQLAQNKSRTFGLKMKITF